MIRHAPSSRYPRVSGFEERRGTMPADHTTLPVLAVIFLATVIRSAFGFGEALVAVPLLALIIPVEVAAPLAVLVSVTVAGVVLVQDWREVHAGSAGRLILSTLFGIPFGLLLLTSVAEPVVKAVLAAVIIAFSAYRLVGRSRFELEDDRLAWLFGFGAGVLGGAYGMNGPPLVAYGALRRWSPERFRATLQGYFLPASLVGMAGYWVAGLWVPAVTRYYLMSLPVVLAATALGRVLNRRMDGRRFLLYVHVGLMVIGADAPDPVGVGNQSNPPMRERDLTPQDSMERDLTPQDSDTAGFCTFAWPPWLVIIGDSRVDRSALHGKTGLELISLLAGRTSTGSLCCRAGVTVQHFVVQGGTQKLGHDADSRFTKHREV